MISDSAALILWAGVVIMMLRLSLEAAGWVVLWQVYGWQTVPLVCDRSLGRAFERHDLERCERESVLRTRLEVHCRRAAIR